MQAFWRLTDSTHHTVYADSSRESTICPHFPGFSLPKRAQLDAIRAARNGSMKRGSRAVPVRGHWNPGSLELPLHLHLETDAVVILHSPIGCLTIGNFPANPECLRHVPDQVGKIGLVAQSLARSEVAIQRVIDPVADVTVQFDRADVAVDFAPPARGMDAPREEKRNYE
jgi:hypothetical protein